MHPKNYKNILFVIVIVMLIKHFYPEATKTILLSSISLIGFYGFYWMGAQLYKWGKERMAIKYQDGEDENTYLEYQKKHDAIRTKFDPNYQWNEATSVPSDYLKEVRVLNLQYREMLKRRNGWNEDDFKDNH